MTTDSAAAAGIVDGRSAGERIAFELARDDHERTRFVRGPVEPAGDAARSSRWRGSR